MDYTAYLDTVKMKRNKASIIIGLVALVVALCWLCGCEGTQHVSKNWEYVREKWGYVSENNMINIFYDSGGDCPQYASLDLNSSYLRLNYGRKSAWGTSLILLPPLWTGRRYYQGSEIVVSLHEDGGNLVISFTGAVSKLKAWGELTIYPPEYKSIRADVKIHVEGEVMLDRRPGEAFKPVMFSSMHVSDDAFDTRYCFLGQSDDALQEVSLPREGWILDPPAKGNKLGLEGGTCSWKKNAPTIVVELDREMEITGWVTYSGDPSCDNVGFWAASEEVLREWSYSISVTEPEPVSTVWKRDPKGLGNVLMMMFLTTSALSILILMFFSSIGIQHSQVPDEVSEAWREVEQATRDGTWYDDSDIYRLDMAMAKAEMENPGSTLGFDCWIGLIVVLGSTIINFIGLSWAFRFLPISRITIAVMSVGVFLALIVPFLDWLLARLRKDIE